jgi:glycosyltransferase involved in cell wall biosynthesis
MYDNTGKNHLYCTPNKLWEFPAAGVPIICNDLVELGGSVRANNIGWVLSDDNDPAALSALVGSLSDADIAQARANCVTYITADNWDVYAQRLVSYYAGINRR